MHYMYQEGDRMGIREQLGGMAEAALMKAVDDNVKELSTDKIKAELYKLVDKMVDEYIGSKLDDLVMKIKANFIDQLDGVDDIPDV